MIITDTAISTLRSVKADFIPQTDIINAVSKKTGKEYESVRGTICKSTDKGLYSVEVQLLTGFRPVPRTATRPAGFEKLKGTAPVVAFHNYDCPVKNDIREHIVQFLDERLIGKKPRIMTFASREGLCVKRFLKKWPKAKITNIECKKEIYDEYCKLGLNTENIFDKFKKAEFSDRFDLINYDANAYLCESMYYDIDRINDEDMADNMVITLQYSKNFRNHGLWVDVMRKEYRKCPDPSKQCMIDMMYKYRLVDERIYRKSNVHFARKMRTYFFEKA